MKSRSRMWMTANVIIVSPTEQRRHYHQIQATYHHQGRGVRSGWMQRLAISPIFWPRSQRFRRRHSKLKHHPRTQAELDQFSTEYGRLKNQRRLVWMNQLGTVHSWNSLSLKKRPMTRLGCQPELKQESSLHVWLVLCSPRYC
jgi:hypothetical protein